MESMATAPQTIWIMLMELWQVFPDCKISHGTPVADQFAALGIDRFHNACAYVHQLPYGYNSDRDDLIILFKEKMGTCTTKHAVIATLAEELELPVVKNVGIYEMTEAIVSGSDAILAEFDLPYIPMLHCFLVCGRHSVDLTQGNRNGKKRAIDAFLYTVPVTPNISAKDEYRLYREALGQTILTRPEMKHTSLRQILKAREEGLKCLKRNIEA